MKTIVLWNQQQIEEYEKKIGKKLMPSDELIKHQKKVIDRLSRKIQKLKTELTKKNQRYFLGGNEVILMSHEKFNSLFGDKVLMAKVDPKFFNPGGEF